MKTIGMSALALGAMLGGLCPAQAAENKPVTYQVQTVRDLAYYDGADADKVKHKLDLYLPKNLKNFPVLFFVHGGAWRTGDKNYFGVYGAIGQFFARHGIGAVVTNYRLSPAVLHPEHIKDVARAFAWTYKHIAEYGGRSDQIFVCGHSAGGHLVALLATDDDYLKEQGLTLQAIKGVMPMSGVYAIPEMLFPSIFGNDATICKKASPINHARPDAPPFLIIYADSDFPTCATVSQAFCRALKDKQCAAVCQEIKDRNHISIIFKASQDDDPTGQALLQFIAEHTRK